MDSIRIAFKNGSHNKKWKKAEKINFGYYFVIAHLKCGPVHAYNMHESHTNNVVAYVCLVWIAFLFRPALNKIVFVFGLQNEKQLRMRNAVAKSDFFEKQYTHTHARVHTPVTYTEKMFPCDVSMIHNVFLVPSKCRFCLFV